MKKMSRIWSVVLTIAMVLSLAVFMPAAGFAAETGGDGDSQNFPWRGRLKKGRIQGSGFRIQKGRIQGPGFRI